MHAVRRDPGERGPDGTKVEQDVVHFVSRAPGGYRSAGGSPCSWVLPRNPMPISKRHIVGRAVSQIDAALASY